MKAKDVNALKEYIEKDKREAFTKHQVWLFASEYNTAVPTIDVVPTDKLIEDIDFAINATNLQDEYSRGMRNGMRYVKSLVDGNKPEYEKAEEHKYFPAIEGALAEMLVDGQWIKGKIVKGYRFDDGIVTIEAEDGKRYWCGQERTDCYREIIDGSNN